MSQGNEELSERDVRSFLHGLKFRLQVASQLDLYLANRFNIFRYLEANEVALSQMICDLLSPDATHGQGATFLNSFLKMLELPLTGEPGKVRVKCEVQTSRAENRNRRIDILVSLDDNIGIGIENKPWAGDQPGWVKDYSDHLSNSFDNYLLVFLTRVGRQPITEQDKGRAEELRREGHFRTILYETEFSNWLRHCQKDSQSDKVKWFLTNFMDYVQDLEANFMASEHERKIVADYLYENPVDLSTAYFVQGGLLEARKRIVLEFLAALKERLEQRLGPDWAIENPGDGIFKAYTNFGVKKSRWRNGHAIVIAPDKPEANDFGMGVRKEEKAPLIDGGEPTAPRARGALAPGRLGRELNEKYEPGTTWPHWEWWCHVSKDYRDWNDPNTLVRLREKAEALTYFVESLTRVAEIASPIIDQADSQ